MTASIAGVYAARQSRFDQAADLAPPPQAYSVAEVSLGADIRVSGLPLRIALQGTNVFGARYREYASLLRYFADQPGQQLMLRISTSFASANQTR